MKRSYRKFNGEYTTKPKEYVASWKVIGSAIEKFLGESAKCIGFDPDFLITYPDGESEKISKRLAKKIYECK